uniref:LRRCT domain-containing protein n=1 Tax=Cyprinus carpio TaxID=7962 RepID=A0A8C1X843_CYPCA
MFVSMRALFIFVVFQCIREAWFQSSCIYTETDYVCKEIPKDYPAGLTSVIFFMSGLGEIGLSMFNSTNLTSVNSLTMAYQGITEIGPQTFDKFQNLKTLNLDNNDLSQVSSDWFSHQVTLEILRLSNNKITTLDHNSLDGLPNLLTLDLSQNQIHYITPSSLLGLSKLRQLDLSNNKLTHLSMDVFLTLNGTKIHLDRNPWDCSCSVNDFAKYLRGLQNASLLQNEMEVCCNSPPDLKGKPVWQVPECKTFTTMSPTTVSLTTGSPGTRNPATVIITKPLRIGHSTLIILIVVLCALVLVICVLSVLYHRKRERKHLQAVKPASEKSEIIQTSESTAKSNGEENRKMKSEIANKTHIATTEMLMRTQQMMVGDEKTSQIYHIYSSGTYETREPIKRVRSAGPVLCRMEIFSKVTEAEVATEEDGVRNDEYYNGWMTSEKEKDNLCVNTEEVEDGRNAADEESNGFIDEVSNTTDTVNSHKELREKKEDTDVSIQDGTSVNQDVLQHFVENDVLVHLNELTTEAGSSEDILQVKHVTSQSEETAENLPYLSIGAEPENQTSGVDQNTAKGTSGPSRPIWRVLTWPPTAAQWKKQWAQNQQVLNVFPQLIFVTGCRHDIRPFHPCISPAVLPTAPQFNARKFLPEITSPIEDVRVTIDEDTYRASLESSNHKVLHLSAQECFSDSNISPREDGRINTNGETWRSGLESTIFSDFRDLSSKNSQIDESEVCSQLFSICNPSFGGSKSKPAAGEEINNKDDKKIQSMKRKTHRVHQSEQVASELQKQSRRAEKAARRPHRDRREGQMCEGSDSRVPPSGGSPKDDSLLLGNEYTFIDLLHEVVENHGRWTRERWRKTQKNKHKLKQSR